MSKVKTTDLMSASSLAREFDTHTVLVQKALEKAGIAPIHSLPMGRGVMRLYEPSAAREAVRRAIGEADRQQEDQDIAKRSTDAIEKIAVDMADLRELIASAFKQRGFDRIHQVELSVLSIEKSQSMLVEQNKILFKHLRDFERALASADAKVTNLLLALGGEK